MPSSSQLNEDQLISSFWESYSGDSTPHSGRREHLWLYHSINIPFPTTPLRQALLSLAYVRAGRLQHSRNLVLKGQEIYGQALRLMQSALYSPELMLNDEILAAARCMVLYEAFESTSGDMAAWQNHIMGIGRIIQLRGPTRHRGPLSNSILESMRYSAMIVSLTRRESSFFGNPDWVMQPWRDTSKDVHQRLYDYGFTLSNLFHMGETAHQHSGGAEFLRILEQIRDSYRGMEMLHEELLSVRTEHPHPLNVDALHELPFGDTTYAITSATLLALDLAFSTFAAALIEKSSSDFLNEHQDLLREISSHTDPPRRRALSKQVLRLLQYCLQTRVEHTRSKAIFPLSVVRWELRAIPEDHAQVQALFDTIASAGQFRIARSVQNAGRAMLPSVVAWTSNKG
ncbi:hypothetical protein AYL99_00234 [Fonsecaea erecta]|uniref:Transcription factor domain-containing protein n=1 Tax=Fonsecaea erecta TaxID=1367422 RepID=A0A178ZX41_9EURO|nr:hypothetical protein AYL99_00234 [Fonsecaea erecta]OAP64262.1 hypothetical protein AYL99_00234 [Fonsecaea erecta]